MVPVAEDSGGISFQQCPRAVCRSKGGNFQGYKTALGKVQGCEGQEGEVAE
jgi:hypothetical protein